MAEIITLGPVAYNPMGAYNSETEYERLDVVLYNNVSYVAKQNVQGQLPTNTNYWDALGVSGADMSDYYTKTQVDTAVNLKYTKPQDGIPKADLDNSVQTSLGKADSALQTHQDISGKEDKLNKITSISSSSTDDQYPTAKCVFEIVGDVESILETLDVGSGINVNS